VTAVFAQSDGRDSVQLPSRPMFQIIATEIIAPGKAITAGREFAVECHISHGDRHAAI
jgi:hypothetical protein